MSRESARGYIRQVAGILEEKQLSPRDEALILASLAQAEAVLEVASVIASRSRPLPKSAPLQGTTSPRPGVRRVMTGSSTAPSGPQPGPAQPGGSSGQPDDGQHRQGEGTEHDQQ